jgi:hypothetical protein
MNYTVKSSEVSRSSVRTTYKLVPRMDTCGLLIIISLDPEFIVGQPRIWLIYCHIALRQFDSCTEQTCRLSVYVLSAVFQCVHLNSILHESASLCVQQQHFSVYLWTYRHVGQNITYFTSHHDVWMFESHTAWMCRSVSTVAVLKYVSLNTQLCGSEHHFSQCYRNPSVWIYIASTCKPLCTIKFLLLICQDYTRWWRNRKIK